MRIVIQIVLALIIVFLGYMVFRSISIPEEYKKIKKARDMEAIAKLKDIRDAQEAYKSAYGKYTSSFDSLELFVKTGFIPLIKQMGTMTDKMLEDGIDQKKAVEKGLIKFDTIKVNVMDSLFKHHKNFVVDNMKFLPIKGTNKTFTMKAGELSSESGLAIPVYEIKVHHNDLYSDIKDTEYNESFRADTMDLVRLRKYVGWKVGSLIEANNGAGNWE